MTTTMEGTRRAILDVDGLDVRFGGIVALDGLSLTIEAGRVYGLIGPNGAGKTTLFNVISRLYEPDDGRITFEGRDLLAVPPHRVARVGIARTFQHVALFPALTVLENVMVGAHTTSRQNFLTAALRLGTSRDERRLRERAHEHLDELDLDHVADHLADGLPAGTLKRVELARALAARPRLLLLDEPASGLTHQEVLELADLIRVLRDRHDLTVVLVEHHMAMVMGASDHVVVLDFGRKIAEGPPAVIQHHPAVIEAYLGRSA